MDAEPSSTGRIRMISDPVEHQGVRDSLRSSFDCGKDMPAEFETLLNRIQ